MDHSEKFWIDGVGATQKVDMNNLYALPGGVETVVNGGQRRIEEGMRKRKIYWGPAVAFDNHFEYMSAEFIFRLNDEEVAKVYGVWTGNDPNNVGDLTAPSLPFHREDQPVAAWPYGVNYPSFSDPNSRIFQWLCTAGVAFSCVILMNPTEIECNANSVECITRLKVKAAGGGGATRNAIMAGVVSGRLIT